MKKKEKILQGILREIYYDPKTGYGGVQALYRQVRAKGYPIYLTDIRRWLKEQETYTLCINPFVGNLSDSKLE